jgi:hypothetical protein
MTTGDDLVSLARTQIGKPYVFGATGPNSFDCSGLVYWCMKQLGVSVGRTTYQQIFDGAAVSQSQLAPGDLVFPDAGHVQIYSGGGKVIEAPHTGANVREVAMWGFWRARRILPPGSGASSQTATLTGVTTAAAVWSNWPIIKQLNAISSTLLNNKFWDRAGMLGLGLVVIVFGLVVMNRKRIEQAAVTTAKAAAKAGEVAAL